MNRWYTGVGLAAVAVLAVACSDNSGDTAPARSATDAPGVQCPNSVVRRVDGGDPGADALPPVDGAVTDSAVAAVAFEEERDALIAKYEASAVKLGKGFGRAWRGESGGDYTVGDVDDFGILVRLRSAEDCPRGADLHAYSGAGLPLFFFAPN